MKTLVENDDFEATVKSIRMASNEHLVATGGFDYSARLFEMETGKLLHTFYEPDLTETVTFIPDGIFLAVGGHSAVIRFYQNPGMYHRKSNMQLNNQDLKE